MTTITSRKIQQQGKLAKQIEDKLSTAQGDSEVASSKCKMTTVLLSVSLTAFLLFQVVYVVVSLTKLAALEEELTQLQSSTKSGICQLPYLIKGRVKLHFPTVASRKFPLAGLQNVLV